MFVIKHRNIFFGISVALVLFSLFSIFFWGLNPSIEFTGGSILEVSYPDGRPEIGEIMTVTGALFLGDILLQPKGENGYVIRTKELSTDERGKLITALSFGNTENLIEERYSLVGPSIGEELKSKAWIAIITVIIGIILFVAFAFRKVSESVLKETKTRVRSWHYGFIAIVALAHDIIIPTGIFAFLGSLFVDAQIDMLFVMALLAILGYSVNDTIVVFDRIRENLRRNQEEKSKKSFSEIVGESLRQTYTRSINTSLTTLTVLTVLFFLGGAAMMNFALVLAIGVIAGTYSSIFLAAPLLVAVHNLRK